MVAVPMPIKTTPRWQISFRPAHLKKPRSLIIMLGLVIAIVLAVALPLAKAQPMVDLGYGVYAGYYNSTSKLNIYKG